jgi:hypothetical protein
MRFTARSLPRLRVTRAQGQRREVRLRLKIQRRQSKPRLPQVWKSCLRRTPITNRFQRANFLITYRRSMKILRRLWLEELLERKKEKTWTRKLSKTVFLLCLTSVANSLEPW